MVGQLIQHGEDDSNEDNLKNELPSEGKKQKLTNGNMGDKNESNSVDDKENKLLSESLQVWKQKLINETMKMRTKVQLMMTQTSGSRWGRKKT